MRKAIAFAVVAIPLVLAGCSHPRAAYYAAPPPPSVYTDIAQRGFHDGFDAARHDMAKGIAPDVDRHPRFRNPPVRPDAFQDYRHGFRDGYERAIHGGPERY